MVIIMMKMNLAMQAKWNTVESDIYTYHLLPNHALMMAVCIFQLHLFIHSQFCFHEPNSYKDVTIHKMSFTDMV